MLLNMEQKQVFKNASWIIVCKIIQSLIQLIIGMVSARYLGPSNYGIISYAASIIAFALPLMKLGLDAILVNEYVESPEKEGEILGTSLLLNVVSSVACMIGVTTFALIDNVDEKVVVFTCALYSLSVFFAAFEMIQFWFQYKLLSKISSIVSLVAYFFVSLYKLFLLILGKGVYWFAVSHSIEYGIIGFMLLFFYFKNGGQKLSFSVFRMKKLLNKSKHYILAALMVVIIQNTDHIMLTSIKGAAENGYYSAAITSAAVVQFVFTAIIDSFRPMIFSAKKVSVFEYEKNISKLYGIVIYLAFSQSIVFTIFSPLIINLLYGADYLPAIPILQILTWYVAFSYMGTIRNIWLLSEEKQKYLLIINCFGIVINILLNMLMIPLWGACGAAVASLLTQMLMNFVFGFIFKPIRRNNELLLRGLNVRFIVTEVKSIVNEICKKG